MGNDIGTGRRKTATARVYLKEGSGNIMINGRLPLKYFGRQLLVDDIKKPLVVSNMLNYFDIIVNTKGGGIVGQAGATRLGIARALVKIFPELKNILRQEKLLTRDPRMKERKKYGLAGARKAFQFSKR
ncbi:MAG: 30S ribosomal protein S9 [Candidatus Coatesbacteria bacterium]|nr:30S ribosomal protein S9 [Candidatus Coatesbacteria bacterium]